MHLQMSSGKWRPFGFGPSVLNIEQVHTIVILLQKLQNVPCKMRSLLFSFVILVYIISCLFIIYWRICINLPVPRHNATIDKALFILLHQYIHWLILALWRHMAWHRTILFDRYSCKLFEGRLHISKLSMFPSQAIGSFVKANMLSIVRHRIENWSTQ